MLKSTFSGLQRCRLRHGFRLAVVRLVSIEAHMRSSY